MAGEFSLVRSMAGIWLSVASALAVTAGYASAATADSPPKLVKEWSIGLWKPRGGPAATTFAGLTDDEYSDPTAR